MILELSLDFMGSIIFPGWLKPEAFHLGPLSVKWYGIAYIVGLFGAYFYARITCENKPIWQADAALENALVPNKRMLEDYMFFCLIGIIVGGRIGHTVLYNFGGFLADPLSFFKVWEGGMAFHGGFLGVCVAAIFFAKSRKLKLARVADVAAISAPIGLGLVRVANFVNQELWGSTTDLPWGVVFKGQYQARHPTQLYEAFLEGFVIFFVLWIASRKFKILTKPGLATGLFLLMYGVFRFAVEFVRLPDEGVTQFGILSRGQAYSLPMVIIGAVVIFWAAKRKAVAPEWPIEETPKDKADADA